MGALENKVALVTGASKGIGSELARGLATEGARVVVNYKNDQAGATSPAETLERQRRNPDDLN